MSHPQYPPIDGDEKEFLDARLDYCRAVMRHKFDGLSDELGRKRLGKTATSMLGVLKHMIDVEKGWFQMHFSGKEVEFTSSPENPDGDFDIAPRETVEYLLAEYEKACQRSRSICARHAPADLSVKLRRSDGERTPLRWIYMHMIDETARHNGHLDIYRELLDGAVDNASEW